VTALSLGLVVGSVGMAGAATSTNYQKEIADWFENDPNPVVMHTNTVATPAVTPVAAHSTDKATQTTPAPAQNNYYHYNDDIQI
ncbi:MAG TPA: hypothetical protein VN456_10515, partial [Desulfosporosinus sp.]|nr:hypothetical protein [Desulfosporosinus sp.]